MSNLQPNTFSAHIAKNAIQELPLTYFEGEVIVVDRPEMVAEAAAYLRQHNAVCYKEYFGNDKKVRAFFGGLHMKGKSGDKEICTFSESEIESIVKYLRDNNVERLYTGHCTGMVGYELIKKYKGEN